MRRRLCTLALPMLLAASHAAAQELQADRVPLTSLDRATIEVTFEGKIKLTGETKYLTYTQPLPSDDEGQDILSVDVTSQPQVTHEIVEDGEGRTVKLTWNDPPAGDLEYSIVVTLARHSFDTPVKVDKKGSAKPFLKSGPLTKPDAAIKKQAKELAKDSTSDLMTALRIALWIHDSIAYDLQYSQDKQDKTVAKVMQVKRGTCDEISHLFISMCRAVDIPAREVSGLSYTSQTWGFHSWSEIRLGDQWVPVDATNAQVGFVDALHVAFARDHDDAKFQQGIQSLGTGMFSVLEHDMDVRIVKASKAKGVIEATMSFDPSTAPAGKPFTAVLTVKNPTSSYLAGPARLVVPDGFAVDGPSIQPFLIGPSSQQVISWNVTSPADLESGATYWYRMGAVTFPHAIAAEKFTIASGLIGEVAAFQDAAGNAIVTVGLKNPLQEDHTGELEVCLYSDWELTGDPVCASDEKLVAPGQTEKLEFSTGFAISGNFAVEVTASLGGLEDRYIQKINVTASP